MLGSRRSPGGAWGEAREAPGVQNLRRRSVAGLGKFWHEDSTGSNGSGRSRTEGSINPLVRRFPGARGRGFWTPSQQVLPCFFFQSLLLASAALRSLSNSVNTAGGWGDWREPAAQVRGVR